jgi:hypothetical protein
MHASCRVRPPRARENKGSKPGAARYLNQIKRRRLETGWFDFIYLWLQVTERVDEDVVGLVQPLQLPNPRFGEKVYDLFRKV